MSRLDKMDRHKIIEQQMSKMYDILVGASLVDRNLRKYSPNDIFMDFVRKNEGYYVTFSQYDKLGIWPGSKSDGNPLGIYCYDLKYAYDFYSKNNLHRKNTQEFDRIKTYEIKDRSTLKGLYDRQVLSILPFAQNANYMIFFKINDKYEVLDFSNFDRNRLEEYIADIFYFDITKYDKDFYENKLKEITEHRKQSGNTDGSEAGHIFWDFLMSVCEYKNYHFEEKRRYNKISGENKRVDIARWRRMLLEHWWIGVVTDPGYKIIHPWEACQSVVLTSDVIDKSSIQVFNGRRHVYHNKRETEKTREHRLQLRKATFE
jgi:hypothetical protein